MWQLADPGLFETKAERLLGAGGVPCQRSCVLFLRHVSRLLPGLRDQDIQLPSNSWSLPCSLYPAGERKALLEALINQTNLWSVRKKAVAGFSSVGHASRLSPQHRGRSRGQHRSLSNRPASPTGFGRPSLPWYSVRTAGRR